MKAKIQKNRTINIWTDKLLSYLCNSILLLRFTTTIESEVEGTEAEAEDTKEITTPE